MPVQPMPRQWRAVTAAAGVALLLVSLVMGCAPALFTRLGWLQASARGPFAEVLLFAVSMWSLAIGVIMLYTQVVALLTADTRITVQLRVNAVGQTYAATAVADGADVDTEVTLVNPGAAPPSVASS